MKYEYVNTPCVLLSVYRDIRVYWHNVYTYCKLYELQHVYICIHIHIYTYIGYNDMIDV